MPQPFPLWMNPVSRWVPPLTVILLMLAATVSAMSVRSDYNTGVGIRVEQPIPFSHKHHVQGLGLDCRFCHTTVDRAASAGFPDTHTCMGCHSQIWPTAPVLSGVRESQSKNAPIVWNRVYALPDHVYFNHSAHINKGVGCVTCHGKVSEMVTIAKIRPFFMKECVSCHQNPDPQLRPLTEIYSETWRSNHQSSLGPALRSVYEIRPSRITQCNVCHR
jgi:hypothetical protein